MTVYDFVEQCVIGKYRVAERVKDARKEPEVITDILDYENDTPESLRDYELVYILPCIERTSNGQYDAVTRIICKQYDGNTHN